MWFGCEEIAFAIRTFVILNCVTVEVRNPHPYAFSQSNCFIYRAQNRAKKMVFFIIKGTIFGDMLDDDDDDDDDVFVKT